MEVAIAAKNKNMVGLLKVRTPYHGHPAHLGLHRVDNKASASARIDCACMHAAELPSRGPRQASLRGTLRGSRRTCDTYKTNRRQTVAVTRRKPRRCNTVEWCFMRTPSSLIVVQWDRAVFGG